MVWNHLVLALILLCLALVPADLLAADPLTLALTPSRDPTALQEAGEAFAQTLTRLTGHPIRVFVASDYAGVVEALRSRRVDLAFVHPVGYVLANREAGCQILVRDIWQGRTLVGMRGSSDSLIGSHLTGGRGRTGVPHLR